MFAHWPKSTEVLVDDALATPIVPVSAKKSVVAATSARALPTDSFRARVVKSLGLMYPQPPRSGLCISAVVCPQALPVCVAFESTTCGKLSTDGDRRILRIRKLQARAVPRSCFPQTFGRLIPTANAVGLKRR